MTLPRPRPPWRRIATSPAFFGAVETIVAGGISGAASFGLRQAGLGVWSVVAAVASAVVIGAGILKAVLEVHREGQRESVHELEGCLETLLAIINTPGSPDYDRRLRATLHVPIDRGKSLVQVIDYVGDDRGGRTAGRRFRADTGLVAQVLQAGTALAASRSIANHETYVQELIEKWGYTEQEARARDMSAMSWMAVPIEYGDTLHGLLYLDSTLPGFFDVPERERACIAASVGIAKFTVRRYTH